MRIGIACGGTGGHIFPGLATAEALRRRGDEVILWLAGKDVESAAVQGWKGPIVTVPFSGFASCFSFRNVGVIWRLMRAARQCLQIMKPEKPDVLLAMGSYASVAPVWAARRLSIPVVLHEANVIPGRAIRFLSRWATAVAVGFDETRRVLRHRRLVVTGMPAHPPAAPEAQRLRAGSAFGTADAGGPLGKRCEQSAVSSLPAVASGAKVEATLAKAGEQWQKLQPDRFTVLVMGGSRGAHRLNEIAAAAIIRLHQQGKAVQVIHLTGVADESAVRQRYEQAGVAHVVFGFLHDMAQAYQRTSWAVCRSGASTCAELAWYGVPALLVPYPLAVHQHQLANARAVETAGAADVRAEQELTIEGLADYLAARMADSDRRERMSQAARRRYRGDAAEALADLVETVGRGK